MISNADVRTTMIDLLGLEHLPPDYLQSMDRMTPSHSAVILYGVVPNHYAKDTFPHEMFFFPDKEIETEEQFLYDPLNPETDPCI